MRAKANGTLDRAYEEAFVELGLDVRKHEKDRRRIVGGSLARTQGKFRGNFVKRITAAFGNDMILVELAAIYTKIGKTPVTTELLKREATAAK